MNIRSAGLGLASAAGAATGRDGAGNGAGNPVVMSPAILWGSGTIPARTGRFAPGAGWRRGGALAVALCLGAGLGGCGGGGGGASASANPTQERIRAVARNQPLFGSVTQSSQSSSGRTQGSTVVSDVAEGAAATVTAIVTGQGLPGDRIAADLGSNMVGGRHFRDGAEDGALFDDELGTVTHPKGRDMWYRALVRGDVNDDGVVTSEGGALGVALLTDRFDARADDEYLTFGAWAYVPNGGNVSRGIVGVAVGASVLGVFSDGMETTDTLPDTGSATYSGHTLGWAVTDFGDGGRPASLLFGVVDLTANFGTSMVSGTISDLRFDLSGLGEGFGGSSYTQRRTTVTLGAAQVGGGDNRAFEFDGMVTGIADDTSIPLAERFNYRVMDGSSRWGGRFFGNDGAGIAPPAIGGTWGVRATATRADGMPGSANLDVAGGFGAWKDD